MSDTINIVNTPIVMYVNEHTLELDGSSITELMEYNSYPIKIHTNENLDGCQLVMKSQNNQTLRSIGNLQRDVKRLFRSQEEKETLSEKAWWVFLENTNEREGNNLIYSGVLKTYEYEEEPTIFPGIKKRIQCKVKDINDIEVKGYFSNNYTTFTITAPVANTTDYKTLEGLGINLGNGKLYEDFSALPKPLDEQLEINSEIPEQVEVSVKKLNIESDIINIKEIEFNKMTLELNSYDEENGYYFYQTNITDSNLKTDLKTEGLEFSSGKIEVQFSEEDFNNYSVNIEFMLKDSNENEENFSYNQKNNVSFNFLGISFDEQEFNMEDILVNETFDDYLNLYTLEDNAEYQAEQYSSAGFNEIVIGIRKTDAAGKTTYVTNSIALNIIRSIESISWYTPEIEIKQCYFGQPKYDEVTKKIIEFFQSDFDKQKENYLPKDTSALYVNNRVKEDDLGKGDSYDTDKFYKIIYNLEVYRWSPGDAEFKLYSNFLIPDIKVTETPVENETENIPT